jgi:DNA repair protein RecN (Recombination protein N)
VLAHLHVRDLGVIDDLTLQLGPGMTALTGETGAGKTLLVGALQLALGGRGTAALVRAGAQEAVVEAAFITRAADGSERETVLGRVLPAAGRARAFVDGRMVPRSALAEAGDELVDICGQHDHQSLLRPGAQRRAVDAFAGTDTEPLAEAVRALRDVEERLAQLGGDEQQRARELDMLRFQISEIDDAAVEDADEEARLRAEEERLADAGAHREAAATALSLLDGPVGADALAATVDVLAGRGAFEPWVARLRSVLAEVADLASDLRAATERWQDDPQRLEAVQSRRRRLGDLRRKYGATLSEVLEFGAEARHRLDELLSADERAAQLEEARRDCQAAVAQAAEVVRSTRQAAAPALGSAVGERLATLAMPGARVDVSVAPDGAGEPVRLLLAANPGEPSQPLSRAASGGELARAMLALRLVTLGGAPVMVFDEVDAGVGGAAALALAQALREVSERHQVLVVTHLAQVAALADQQVVLDKRTEGGRTVTTATALDQGARVVEISRMLSGHPDSETAQAHAAELLSLGRAAVP